MQAEALFGLDLMKEKDIMRYKSGFPQVVPRLKTGWSRVTHPFATRL